MTTAVTRFGHKTKFQPLYGRGSQVSIALSIGSDQAESLNLAGLAQK